MFVLIVDFTFRFLISGPTQNIILFFGRNIKTHIQRMQYSLANLSALVIVLIFVHAVFV